MPSRNVNPERFVRVVYRNWRGETTERRIVPTCIWYGEISFSPGEQWLLDGFDLDSRTMRTFAMSGIVQWLKLMEENDEK